MSESVLVPARQEDVSDLVLFFSFLFLPSSLL